MVRRFDILTGDKTTAQGTVQQGATGDRIGEVEQAYEGDPVWCPACKTTGHISCTGPRLPTKGPDGREAALSDDLCTCECERHPCLVPSQFASYIDV
ncbi:PAAR domain-containing protein [Pandoraea sp.]|uniref:PAAR domain-containing protein n=1 Tax=Pandoraea sp. TaxID=1883445 RepID=UPI0035AF1226